MSTSKGLQQKIDQLEAENASLNEMVYMAAHNLKAPLTSLRGVCQVARKRIDHQDSVTYFDLVDQGLDGMEMIIRNLLQLAQTASAPISYQPVDLGAILDQIIRDLTDVNDPNFPSIQTDFLHQEPIYSDAAILSSSIQNLVENGIKYADPAKAAPFVRIRTADEGQNIKITVEDNGLGIPPDLTTKIFDMFFRAHEGYPGNGLGLYIVSKGIKRLGGHIEVASQEGQGSQFQFTFQKRPK